jgi:hypothetical protein
MKKNSNIIKKKKKSQMKTMNKNGGIHATIYHRWMNTLLSLWLSLYYLKSILKRSNNHRCNYSISSLCALCKIIIQLERQGEETAKRINSSRQGKSYLKWSQCSNNFFPVLMYLIFWHFLPPAFELPVWNWMMSGLKTEITTLKAKATVHQSDKLLVTATITYHLLESTNKDTWTLLFIKVYNQSPCEMILRS